jgi:hypothetical protein
MPSRPSAEPPLCLAELQSARAVRTVPGRGTRERSIRCTRETFVYGRDFAGDADATTQVEQSLGTVANMLEPSTADEQPIERFVRDENRPRRARGSRPLAPGAPLNRPRSPWPREEVLEIAHRDKVALADGIRNPLVVRGRQIPNLGERPRYPSPTTAPYSARDVCGCPTPRCTFSSSMRLTTRGAATEKSRLIANVNQSVPWPQRQQTA